jgi:hypothetical protein
MASKKPPKPRVVARGKGKVRTDAEIEEMTSAEAMEKIANEAAKDFEEHAPRNFRNLLKARKKE